MNKKNRSISVITSIFVITLLSLNTSIGATSERDWLEGDVEIFGLRMSELYCSNNLLTHLVANEIMVAEMEYQLELLDVDRVSYNYTMNTTLAYGSMGEMDATGNMEIIADELISSLLYFEYKWDDTTNSTKLVDFNIGYNMIMFFIEPDWEMFSQALEETFDRDRIIASVAHDATFTNITMGDFLDSLTSYQILGVEGFPGNEELTTPAHEWTFSFDLNQSIYDYENHHIYGPTYSLYEMYNASFELAYSEGGTLDKSYSIVKSGLIEDVNYGGNLYVEYEMIQDLLRGGLNPEKTSVNLYSIIGTVLIVPIIVYILKRKRNKV